MIPNCLLLLTRFDLRNGQSFSVGRFFKYDGDSTACYCQLPDEHSSEDGETAMQSNAKTVEQYLKELPEDRRAAISAIRKMILQNLDKDFEEGIQYGMIGYYVPHRFFPDGYHCDPKQPLPFVSVASQKNHMAVYLMCIYMDKSEEQFRSAWLKSGKKLDMGKSCIRFKKLEDVALDVIADVIRNVSAKGFVARYQEELQKNEDSDVEHLRTDVDEELEDGEVPEGSTMHLRPP